MSGLIKYEAARLALAECKTFDEAKSWVDKAAAMKAYGHMAKDKSMEIDAAEIRLRAERRLGEMLIEQKENGGLNSGAKGLGKSALPTRKDTQIPKLEDAGIDYKLSSRAQKYAAVPAAEFDAIVSDWREKVSEEGVRVSLQLEAAGDAVVKAARHKPQIKAVSPIFQKELNEWKDRYTVIEKERDELLEKCETLNDAAQELAISHEVAQLLNGDTARKIRDLKDTVRTLEIRRDGLMNEKNEYIKLVKSLQRKLDKKNAA